MPSVTVQSFSFRRGVPTDADMVFDVRFLKNPHYDPALTAMTGRDAAAGAYIETDPQFALFFEYLKQLAVEKLPACFALHRQDFSLAIGCTGGRHRSVYVTEKLAGELRNNGFSVVVFHKELSHEG